jgi:hypothetical protein
MRKERITLPSGTVRLFVQQVGADIDSVGPDDGSSFRIDAHPDKKARIIQLFDEARPADDPGSQVHSTGRTVREGQFDDVGFECPDRNYARVHGLRQRFNPLGTLTGTQTPPILQQLDLMETTPLHDDCQHPGREVTVEQAWRRNANLSACTAIGGVKVWRTVLVEVHPDHDPEKP